MGCFVSKEVVENKNIDANLRKAELHASQTVKILVLGTGDSGKTTFRKQLRVLYGEGFPETVRKQVAPVIVGNLLEGLKDVLLALPDLKLQFEDANLLASAAVVEELVPLPPFLTPELSTHVKSLIASKQVQEAVEKRREFQLQDCWLLFSKQIFEVPEWGLEQWIPDTESCVSVRVRTSGIVEETLKIKDITFQIFDVGGQRAERRKWIHSFDNVTTVLFITAISEYDQVLFEDRSKNRLEEALMLFEEICNSRFFLQTPLILFLNKKDLFEEKYLVKKIPINQSGCFPNAPLEGADIAVVIEWITNEFRTKRKNPSKPLYTHVTDATDANNIKKVFEVCQKVILKGNLEQAGFIMQ